MLSIHFQGDFKKLLPLESFSYPVEENVLILRNSENKNVSKYGLMRVCKVFYKNSC